MEDQLISYEMAILAKEKKFSFHHTIEYNGNIIVIHDKITQSLLAKWLREIHNIYIQITTDNGIDFGMCLNIIDEPESSGYWKYFFKTYEEALEAGLYEALKLI